MQEKHNKITYFHGRVSKTTARHFYCSTHRTGGGEADLKLPLPVGGGGGAAFLCLATKELIDNTIEC